MSPKGRALLKAKQRDAEMRAELVQVEAVRVYCPCGRTSLATSSRDIERARAGKQIRVRCSDPDCAEEIIGRVGDRRDPGAWRHTKRQRAFELVRATDETKREA